MEPGQSSSHTETRHYVARRISYTLLAILLLVYGLMSVRNFLYPIAFGFLLGYLLYPMANWFEKKHFPRILANLIVIAGGLLVLAGLLLGIYSIITPLAINLPELAGTARENLSEMMARLGTYFGFEPDNTREAVNERLESMFEATGQQLQALFGATTTTAVAFGLLPVYIFLFLYYRTKFMYFLLQLGGRKHKTRVIAILREMSTMMVRYLYGVLVVVLILCVINSLGIWIIGLRFPIPLGVAAALFNFIPYFGTLLGGLVPFFFAFLVEGDPVLAFRVAVLFIGIQFIENNILTPNIVGGNVNISPFFVIIGLVAASMIWGVPGMLLIVPMLAGLRIVFSHSESMQPYAYLLGRKGTSRHSIRSGKLSRWWKKLRQKAAQSS